MEPLLRLPRRRQLLLRAAPGGRQRFDGRPPDNPASTPITTGPTATRTQICVRGISSRAPTIGTVTTTTATTITIIAIGECCCEVCCQVCNGMDFGNKRLPTLHFIRSRPCPFGMFHQAPHPNAERAALVPDFLPISVERSVAVPHWYGARVVPKNAVLKLLVAFDITRREN